MKKTKNYILGRPVLVSLLASVLGGVGPLLVLVGDPVRDGELRHYSAHLPPLFPQVT